MNTRFQISSQRGQCSLWSGMHSGPSDRCAPRSKWISLHGPHGPVSAIRQKLLSSPLSTSPQRAIRSGGRPISSRQIDQATSSSVYVVAARRSAGMPRSRGQEVPRPVDGVALEVVAEAPVAEHLEEGVVPWRPADLLEVVVLAGHAQDSAGSRRPACTTVFSAPVRTSLNWTIPEFVNSSVWSPAGTRLALGTTVWPRSAKNSTNRRRISADGRAWIRGSGRTSAVRIGRNGTQRTSVWRPRHWCRTGATSCRAAVMSANGPLRRLAPDEGYRRRRDSFLEVTSWR